ncbi:MAG: GIY-YIG nuclease family protein [Ignavibacteria bacterium]|nr:GIY-YIG nuclease family protein [Ignavibacteria bacterium]MCC7158560.1 GIY-YIG nuclease family protein [Ignavibacteria bacterium]
MKKTYYVYMLASKKNGTIYTGVTGDLFRRVYEHKKKEIRGFTKRYNVDRLVHFEETDDISIAITREKQTKGWIRKKKITLIEETNPNWDDLAEGWFDL